MEKFINPINANLIVIALLLSHLLTGSLRVGLWFSAASLALSVIVEFIKRWREYSRYRY